MTMNLMNNLAAMAGRIMLAAIFIWSAGGKIVGYAGTSAYMAKFGVSATLLPIVIAVEGLAAVMLLVGWRTRAAALALAAFCIISALIFHSDFADRNQMIHFMKNLSMAGGLLALFVAGGGAFSADGKEP